MGLSVIQLIQTQIQVTGLDTGSELFLSRPMGLDLDTGQLSMDNSGNFHVISCSYSLLRNEQYDAIRTYDI